MGEIKRIPYGVSDFVSVRERNMYYVDKTMFLKELEAQPANIFFIRPRRFGKSLFLSMLRAYYDKAMTDKFERLFGDLWIGQHPTPLKNRYQILYLDFSRVGGDTSHLSENFDQYFAMQMDLFIHKYRADYPDIVVDMVLAAKKGDYKLNIITAQANELGIALYLIIDEYDNFTNIVLNEEGEEVYHAITHASGFYRELFKKFKGAFERIFMTGVSPVTLDDLTSGFNIGWHISTNPRFDKMLGFSTEDVRAMLTYYKEMGQLPAGCDVETMITEMKPWYDNYCFAEECLQSDMRVFNCDMVLYYVCCYIDSGCPPKQMLDPNTKTDYAKLKKLLQLDRLDGDRRGVLMKIAEEGQIITELFTSFPARELTNPEIFPSLLFYYGMLTMVGTRGNRLILGIPNNNVRKQYYSYLLEMYQPTSNLIYNELNDYFDNMAFDGHWEKALRYIADAYEKLSSVRDMIEGEQGPQEDGLNVHPCRSDGSTVLCATEAIRNIQGFFLAYLSLNSYYLTAPEVELNHGFCDFFLLPDLTHYKAEHSYILELKYLSKKDFAEKSEIQWNEAIEQIHRYAVAPRVEALRQGTRLHKVILQFAGWELARMEEIY